MSLSTAPWAGRTLCGRYQVSALLGAGGMGFVYRARDKNLDTEVVIKTPRPEMLANPQFVGRFAREVRSLVQLVHPHIVKVMDVGEHDGVPFAVLQYLTGGSLRQRRGPQTPAELLTWLPDVAAALDFIHERGYIHRDVKPDNILFDEAGHVYLSDFGVAKTLVDTRPRDQKTVVTGTGAMLGTLRYLSPEFLMDKRYDGRMDQYALAVTVYEVLAGKPPFDGPSAAVIAQHMTQLPPPMHEVTPSISKALSAAVAQALAKKPSRRYASCTAFAEAVRGAASAKTGTPARRSSGKAASGASMRAQKKVETDTTVLEETGRRDIGKTGLVGLYLSVLVTAFLVVGPFLPNRSGHLDYDPEPRIGIAFRDDNQRFGLVMLKERDPKNSGEFKKLTFSRDGTTNNTCIGLTARRICWATRPAPGRVTPRRRRARMDPSPRSMAASGWHGGDSTKMSMSRRP